MNVGPWTEVGSCQPVSATVLLHYTVLVIVGLMTFGKSKGFDRPTLAPQVVGQKDKDMLNNVQHCRSH